MFKKALILLMTAVMALMISAAAAEDEMFQVQVDVEYVYKNAESMLTLINEFRTGEEAWYWNTNDTEKISVTGLKPLTYDYGLEKAAMKRAAELAVHYAHTRPIKKNCVTIYTELDISYGYAGENIAAGYVTKESVFDAWKEENEHYSGQGHRRNMLNSNYSSIGIGCVYSNGYYYWAQEFCSSPSGQAQEKYTGPADITCSKELMLAGGSNNDPLKILGSGTDSLEVAQGESAALPVLTATCGWHSFSVVTILGDAWTTEDSSVIEIKDGKVYAVSPGKGTMKAKLDSSVTASVISLCNTHKWDEGTVTKKATCTEEGTKAFTCEVCGKTKEETIAALPHTLKAHAKVDATCTETGTEAYWTCDVCEKLFSDAEGKAEIEAPAVIAAKGHTLKAHAKVDATCTETGTEAYWTCDICEKLFSDEKGKTEIEAPAVIAAKGHNWGNPEYVWSADKHSVEATRICKHDAAHVETEISDVDLAVVSPSNETAGTATYSAVFDNEAFEKQTKEIKIPALNKLSVLNLPTSIKTIEDEAFTNLTCQAVIIPDGCTTIGKKAFSGCKNLLYIRIPASVKDYPDNAFEGCNENLVIDWKNR